MNQHFLRILLAFTAFGFISAEMALAQAQFGRPNPADYDPAKFGRAPKKADPSMFGRGHRTKGTTTKPGEAAPATGLTLNTGWNRKPAGRLKISNMAKLFSGITANFDREPNPGQVIWGEITYLMPLGEAVKTFDQTVVSRQTVSTPGMPYNSFFYRMWKGSFGMYDRIVLTTDAKDQVVMVMLMKESPRSRLFSPTLHSRNWNLLNLVHDRAKAQRDWRIHHVRKQVGQNYIITSELVDDYSKPREQLELYIPKQVAGVVAGLVQLADR